MFKFGRGGDHGDRAGQGIIGESLLSGLGPDQRPVKLNGHCCSQGAVNRGEMFAKEGVKRSGQVVGHAVDPPGEITAFSYIDIVQGPLQYFGIAGAAVAVALHRFTGIEQVIPEKILVFRADPAGQVVIYP